MALIEIKKDPSAGDLTWFGVIVLAFSGVLGLVTWRVTGGLTLPVYIWSGSAALVLVYYAVPATRRPLFIGWMYACYPLGWVMSHVLLAGIYFGVMTPIGLLMRAIRHDPLQRRFEKGATSYWVDHQPATGVKRYFRQF